MIQGQKIAGTVHIVLPFFDQRLVQWEIVVEMISELLDPLNAGERLSSYIDLPKRLGCPASDPDRLCCLQATSRLPGETWRSLEEPTSASSGWDEWRDLKWISTVCWHLGALLNSGLRGVLDPRPPSSSTSSLQNGEPAEYTDYAVRPR
jgi:hypothetical protein